MFLANLHTDTSMGGSNRAIERFSPLRVILTSWYEPLKLQIAFPDPTVIQSISPPSEHVMHHLLCCLILHLWGRFIKQEAT